MSINIMYNNSPPLARCFHISVVFIIITIIITPVLAHGPQSVEAAQVGGGADILPGDKQNIRQDYHPHITLAASHYSSPAYVRRSADQLVVFKTRLCLLIKYGRQCQTCIMGGQGHKDKVVVKDLK